MSHHTEICVAFNHHFASAGFLFENPDTGPPLSTVDLISGVLSKAHFFFVLAVTTILMLLLFLLIVHPSIHPFVFYLFCTEGRREAGAYPNYLGRKCMHHSHLRQHQHQQFTVAN